MSNLHPRDIKKLSAYLDQELSRREIQKLDLRLKAEPTLRAALQDLEETKKVLARLPRVSAPHNFTLTRAMAGEIKGRSFYPLFRLASVVATVAFAVLVGADAFLLDQAGGSQFAAPLAAIGVSEEIDSEAQFADEPSANELFAEDGVAAEAPMEDAVDEAGPQIFPTPTGSLAMESDAGFAAGTETLGPTQTPCRDCPTEMERAAVNPTGTAFGPAGAGETAPEALPTLPLSPLPPAADLELAEETKSAPIPTLQLPTATLDLGTTSASQEPKDLVRIAEVASGLAALFFAALALFLRRAY